MKAKAPSQLKLTQRGWSDISLVFDFRPKLEIPLTPIPHSLLPVASTYSYKHHSALASISACEIVSIYVSLIVRLCSASQFFKFHSSGDSQDLLFPKKVNHPTQPCLRPKDYYKFPIYKMDFASSALSQMSLDTNNPISSPNAHNPSCTLPPEILGSIFVIHRYLTLNGFKPSSTTFGHTMLHYELMLLRGPIIELIPYIAPSHTCSIWRSVALSTPMLWNSFSLKSLEWTTEFLRRSGQGVPLDVTLPEDYEGGGRSSLLMILEPAIAHRLRKLILPRRVFHRIASNPDLSSCFADPTTTLSGLRELELSSPDSSSETITLDDRSIMWNLLSTPGLRRVSIQGTLAADWAQPPNLLSDGLTHLTIDACEDSWGIVYLNSLLSHTSSLEYLDVCGLNGSGLAKLHMTKISLPSLITVNLAVTLITLRDFLDYFDLPKHAHLRLLVWVPGQNDTLMTRHELSSVLRLLTPRISDVQAMLLGVGMDETHLVFSHSTELLEYPSKSSEEMSERFAKSCPAHEYFPYNSFLNLSFRFSTRIASETYALFLEYFRPLVADSKVKYVGMRGLYLEDGDFDDVKPTFMDWLSLFQRLQTVETLNLRLNSLPAAILLDALHPTKRDDFPFPALQTLILRYFDLEKAIGQHDSVKALGNLRGFEQVRPWDRSSRILTRTFQARRGGALPDLQSLVLHDCTGVTEMLQSLFKQLVMGGNVVVQWSADKELEAFDLLEI
ncbi:hypothetical protein DL96DRAFT_279535 [Flagelloscypha sp. PMI_526]|nr:hypothetical protein DL96DRAFT_279535 [Flagelloscypha sp. PMI_526]